MSWDLACTVTGANGFVGRNLVRALMDQEEYSIRVFAVDSKPFDSNAVMPWPNKRSNVSFHKWDVTQPLHSEFLGVDAIYHFAGIADPKRYVSEPLKVMDLNIKSLTSILEKIMLWDAQVRPRIIYSSTSEVYGKNEAVPFEEDATMMFGNELRWCYALTKATGEMYLRAYAKEHGIRHTIFRFFNFVGPDIDAPGAGRVLTQMVAQALDEGEIYVTAPGTQTRCFTHIDDVTPALVRALTKTKDHPSDPYNEFDYQLNLGNDEQISMIELAQLVREKVAQVLQHTVGSYGPLEVKIREGKLLFGQGYADVRRRQPSLEGVREVLGWQPTRSQMSFLPDLIAELAYNHMRVSRDRRLVGA